MSRDDYDAYTKFAGLHDARNSAPPVRTVVDVPVQPVDDMTTDEDREQWLSGDRDNSEAEEGAADWWDSDSDDQESEEEY